MELRVCALYSGSNGNATYVGTERTHILVDAGLPGKNISIALNSIGIQGEALKAILITHEHSDHIRGAGILSRKFDIPVYANEKTWAAMEDKLGAVALANRRTFSNAMDFYIDDINVSPYEIPHDAADPVGFCFQCRKRKVAIATDLGHTNSKIIKMVMDSDLVILEANHDLEMLKAGPYPQRLKNRILGRKGHLSNEDTGRALLQMLKGRVTHVLLAHLSKENNHPQIAFQTVAGILEAQGVAIGEDIVLDMTYRDKLGNFYHIG